jgi:hypothetical protein
LAAFAVDFKKLSRNSEQRFFIGIFSKNYFILRFKVTFVVSFRALIQIYCIVCKVTELVGYFAQFKTINIYVPPSYSTTTSEKYTPRDVNIFIK